MFLSNLLNDPRAALIGLLLSLPGILLALCAHESAHAYIADRCGDPTARLMGRISLNPLRHIDPIGFACMFLVGFGWAKPVPVNPNNLRNGRRDDLKVSLAGIVTNLILCLLSFLLMMVIVQIAIHKTPSYTGTLAYYRAADVDVAFVTVGGERYLASSLTLDMKELFNACGRIKTRAAPPSTFWTTSSIRFWARCPGICIRFSSAPRASTWRWRCSTSFPCPRWTATTC